MDLKYQNEPKWTFDVPNSDLKYGHEMDQNWIEFQKSWS